MEKGARMFVRQSCSSCRQENVYKLSTRCLQVVDKHSIYDIISKSNRARRCQRSIFLYSLIQVTCNPFKDVMTMIAKTCQ
jgi:hypothetical protein